MSAKGVLTAQKYAKEKTVQKAGWQIAPNRLSESANITSISGCLSAAALQLKQTVFQTFKTFWWILPPSSDG